MRSQIDEFTTSLRSLIYRAEEYPLDMSERAALENACVYMNRAVESFEEFSNYTRAIVECMEGRRLNDAQEAAANVYTEIFQIMQLLDDAKSKLSHLAYN